jgi:hypothetical protein
MFNTEPTIVSFHFPRETNPDTGELEPDNPNYLSLREFSRIAHYARPINGVYTLAGRVPYLGGPMIPQVIDYNTSWIQCNDPRQTNPWRWALRAWWATDLFDAWLNDSVVDSNGDPVDFDAVIYSLNDLNQYRHEPVDPNLPS